MAGGKGYLPKGVARGLDCGNGTFRLPRLRQTNHLKQGGIATSVAKSPLDQLQLAGRRCSGRARIVPIPGISSGP